MKTKQGWAVEIERKDKTTFLASGSGDLPVIWVKSNRKWAVVFKKDLQQVGFKCRVVPMNYTEPEIIRG